MIFSWLRRRRWRRLLATPFPSDWLPYLQNNVALYGLLSEVEQAKLRDDLRILIADKTWEGCGGLTITDEIKVTIAAQASLLLLGMEHDAARLVQKQLYRDHGTTLAGLIAVHGIDPEPYLAFVHDIDLSELQPDPHLIAALARLPGRRFVFTNGCRNHATRILERLALANAFDEVWDIRTIGFVPKPAQAAYDAVVKAGGVTPGAAAMFDDIARNLVVPHELGMTTVWLDGQSDWARQGPEFPVASKAHIDHETRDLCSFLNSLGI